MTIPEQEPNFEKIQQVLSRLDLISASLDEFRGAVLASLEALKQAKSSDELIDSGEGSRTSSLSSPTLWGNTQFTKFEVLRDKNNDTFILRPKSPNKFNKSPSSKNDCGSDCRSDCGSDCRSDCGSDCRSDCGSDCRSDCGSDCRSDCGSDCRSDCGSDCRSDCGSDCRSDCGSDCRSDCGSDCRSDCGSDCRSDCGADCRSDCGSDRLRPRGADCSRDFGSKFPRQPIDEIEKRLDAIEKLLKRSASSDNRRR
jgi:hypothetical protein